MTIPIAPNSVLCVICGAEPSYSHLTTIAQNIFRNETPTLQMVERCVQRSLPEHLEIDPNVLAIILANSSTRR